MNPVRAVAVFLLGLITGAAGWMAITAREMDELHYTIEQYRLQVDRLTEELNGLRAKLNQQSREPEIRTIEVQVQTNDHFAEIAILRFAKDQTKTLIGKSLSTLNDHPDLIIGLLEGRTILVDGRVWAIHVQSVVLGETVHLYLTGEPAPPQPSPSPAFPTGSWAG
ncbi:MULTISPECIES: hypothetical protein [Kyrpidia]|uniref:Uncharacterized protein n=2 Tax=Kyrpidia spormannii TaxID=2055160 RepID=A0ACA8ZE91_9BACL|nr:MULTISPECIES: hypothetical protein [Kyrpidia]MCL6576704.1 hypothetical protein [Kyrpidia sp.]CAB3393409.1 conserved protein of unknown function [Kyrpidia spormannii]CAB3394330.1 conserved protein of unknown function [Kyrpidia spormannii]HHY67123.1 hypothetical protein [Alicyclobacillus sp.]